MDLDIINVEYNTKLPDGHIKPLEQEVFNSDIFHTNIPTTKGEEIAIKAMAAMLSNPEIAITRSHDVMQDICRSAIYMADIMMKEFKARSK